MAKQSSTRKRGNALALSGMELDTALILTELCRGVRQGDRPAGSSVKRKGEERNDDDHPRSNGGGESSASTPTTTLAKGIFLDNDDDDDEDEDENDFHLRPRKRRFRSIDDIYRSTKPQDNYNPKDRIEDNHLYSCAWEATRSDSTQPKFE